MPESVYLILFISIYSIPRDYSTSLECIINLLKVNLYFFVILLDMFVECMPGKPLEKYPC